MEKKANFLVPKHDKLSKDQVNSLLEKYSLTDVSKLPKIKISDPALAGMKLEIGDVIEITRQSFVGESKYYRAVIE
ncbi:MAG: DNA-directed RNA polymerase subunit H [Nanoarchaeota archaeon]|nr:DNA-directed RNA polymerase subunit H [Nanoarchaeota archaeon]